MMFYRTLKKTSLIPSFQPAVIMQDSDREIGCYNYLAA